MQINWQETILVRHKVLWPEKAPSFCQVEGDEDATHYGVMVDEQLVCVASIYINTNRARLRKFATLENFQNRGIGSTLLKYILTDMEKLQISYFWFDARESAVSFYKKLGFRTTGAKFFKSNVPYFKMEKTLIPRHIKDK